MHYYCTSMVPTSHLSTMARRLTTSSAMNPSLMLCLMVSPLSLAISSGLFFAHAVLPAVLFISVGFAPVAVSLWQLVKFTNGDASRLQDGEHNEEMYRLSQSIGVRENDIITERPISGNLIGNPKIEHHSGE